MDPHAHRFYYQCCCPRGTRGLIYNSFTSNLSSRCPCPCFSNLRAMMTTLMLLHQLHHRWTGSAGRTRSLAGTVRYLCKDLRLKLINSQIKRISWKANSADRIKWHYNIYVRLFVIIKETVKWKWQRQFRVDVSLCRCTTYGAYLADIISSLITVRQSSAIKVWIKFCSMIYLRYFVMFVFIAGLLLVSCWRAIGTWSARAECRLERDKRAQCRLTDMSVVRLRCGDLLVVGSR